MWPFKRTKSVPFCDHDWRLFDTFIRPVQANVLAPDFCLERVSFFTVKCATCGKQRTFNEKEFAHFRKYFNIKMPEVSADESA